MLGQPLRVRKAVKDIRWINQKIRKGDVAVLRADEFKRLVESKGVEAAAKEVDVITTGTFGAMCSSGAVINLGHADPPIKIDKAWLNDVPVCHPGAAVDLYIGATQMSTGYEILFDEDKCIACGICIDACPMRALSIIMT